MRRFIAVLICLALVVATIIEIIVPDARVTPYRLGGVIGAALALLVIPVASVLAWPLFRLESSPPYYFASIVFAVLALLALYGATI